MPEASSQASPAATPTSPGLKTPASGQPAGTTNRSEMAQNGIWSRGNTMSFEIT